MHPLLRGALAGTVATVPMSAVMLAAGKLGLMGAQPPEVITRSAVDVVSEDPQPLPEPAANAVSSVMHLGFGAVAGAAYALLPRVGAPVFRGSVVGLAIWASAYQGWVPALGIMPPAMRDEPGRPLTMAGAHVVFGSVLGLLEERWR